MERRLLDDTLQWTASKHAVVLFGVVLAAFGCTPRTIDVDYRSVKNSGAVTPQPPSEQAISLAALWAIIEKKADKEVLLTPIVQRLKETNLLTPILTLPSNHPSATSWAKWLQTVAQKDGADLLIALQTILAILETNGTNHLKTTPESFNALRKTLNRTPVISIDDITTLPSIGNLFSIGKVTVNDADVDIPTLTYQWQKSVDGGTTFVDITGATDISLRPTLNEAHAQLRCTVFANDSWGGITGMNSKAFSIQNNPPTMGNVSHDGPKAVGQTLTCSGTASDPDNDTSSHIYKWQRSNDNISYTDITGATTNTYTLTTADSQKYLRCQITAIDGFDSSTSTPANSTGVLTTANPIVFSSPSANTSAQAILTIAGSCESGLVINLSGTGLASPTTTTCSAGAFSEVITFTVGAGNKDIILTQTDAAGNATSVTRTFIRDNTPPILTFTSPAANTNAQNGITIVGDCESGLVINLSGTGLASPATTTCSAGTFSEVITFTVGAGNKDIILTQTDAAGNATSVTRTFIRDNTPPILTFTSPAANTNAQNGITIVGDCESGLVINLSGTGLASPATTSCSAGTFSEVITFTVGAGNKDITLTQTDAAGNTTSVTRTFVNVIGWLQKAYIKAANNDEVDNFGQSISISGDTLAVGSYYEDSNQTNITNGSTASDDDSSEDSGAVYIYRRTNSNWAQEAYVKAINGEGGVFFGESISISGDTLSVGTSRERSNQTTITNGDTASADVSNTDSGAVYIYQRSGTNWAQQAYIKAANNDSNDRFGNSISLSGDILAVGSFHEESNQTTITNDATASVDNSFNDSGAVYLYHRNGSAWTQEAYIKAANNDAWDEFGYAVSLSGDTLAVGNPYEASNQTNITNGATASIDNSAPWAGAVYVYRQTGTTWAQEAYIKAANSELNDFFGYSISLSGDTLAVGAPLESSHQTTITNGTTASTSNSSEASGAVFIYRRNVTTWTQEAYIKAANNDAFDQFGSAVALSGDTLAVGALYEASNQTTITNDATASADDSYSQSGAAYIYRRNGTAWIQESYIKAVNNNVDLNFGFSVSLSGDSLAIGTPNEKSTQTSITNGDTAANDAVGNISGAVYVYRNATRLFEVADLRISSQAVGQITVDWERNWGTGTQVIVAKLAGNTAPADCSVGSGGVNLGNVTTVTHTGLTSSSRYTYRVCTSDGTTVSTGIVISTVVK